MKSCENCNWWRELNPDDSMEKRAGWGQCRLTESVYHEPEHPTSLAYAEHFTKWGCLYSHTTFWCNQWACQS